MKIFIKVSLFVSIFIILIIVFVYIKGRMEFNKGEAFFKKKEFKTAVVHFQRAVRWYIPIVSKTKDSLNYLIKIAQIMQSNGEDEEALNIYRRARGSIMSIRWLITPFRDKLDFINNKIAELMAKNNGKEKKEKYLSQLKKTFAPNPFFSFFAVSSFILWIISTFFCIKYSFREDGKILLKNLYKWGSISFFFLFLWIIFLRFS